MRRVVLAVAFVFLVGCGSGSSEFADTGPEPGSPADRYCDVATTLEGAQQRDPTGEDTIGPYNGKYYSYECVQRYPKEAP